MPVTAVATSAPAARLCPLDAGIAWLVAQQRADGTWTDYAELPIGAAVDWVTAFVAAALAASAPDDTHVAAAVQRAADALLAAQGARGGWGWNAAVPPDADSTAWAILALRAASHAIPAPAAAFLRAQQRPSGGFATYARADAWGHAHPDVTPVAALALLGLDASDRAVGFCRAAAEPDGTWPAYWWRGRHYSTYWNRALLAATRQPAPPLAPTRTADPSHAIASAFDLAWVLALAVLDGDPPAACDALADLLAEQQSAAGSWPGGENLRITAPNLSRPWLAPAYAAGPLVRDAGVMTTAAAVRALALHSAPRPA